MGMCVCISDPSLCNKCSLSRFNYEAMKEENSIQLKNTKRSKLVFRENKTGINRNRYQLVISSLHFCNLLLQLQLHSTLYSTGHFKCAKLCEELYLK